MLYLKMDQIDFKLYVLRYVIFQTWPSFQERKKKKRNQNVNETSLSKLNRNFGNVLLHLTRIKVLSPKRGVG